MSIPKSICMKNLYLFFVVLFTITSYSQTNTQNRYQSGNRLYYVWSEAKEDYEPIEEEFEHSIIEIREIGSKTNGYIIITINDNGRLRLYHGSIIDYYLTEYNEQTWVMRSKNTRGKLMYDEKQKMMTFSFESDGTRYKKVFKFYLTSELIAEAN